MNRLLSRLITKVKKEDFEISNGISFSYLFLVFATRVIMYIRGLLIFRKFSHRAFVGPRVVLKCVNKIFSTGNLTIDRGCYIDALSKDGIILGNNVSVGKFTTIECTGSLKFIGEGLKIGDNVGLGTHGFYGCAGGVKIGSDTIFGNFVSVHSENHNYSDLNIPIRLQGVNRQGIIIGANCWIGAKVTILDGAVIEDGVIIAAGSVVLKGIYKKESIYGGVPAKLLKTRN